jgi:hypothetical protein
VTFVAQFASFCVQWWVVSALRAMPITDNSLSAQAMRQMLQTLGSSLAGIPFVWAAAAVLTAAQCRAILQPERRGLAFMRIGGDEWRMALVSLILTAILIPVALVIAMIVAFVIGLLTTTTHVSPQLVNVAPFAVLAPFVLLACFVIARLSLASALTLEGRRINVFGSWRLTRGQSGKLFAIYFLLGVAWIIAYLAIAWVWAAAELNSPSVEKGLPDLHRMMSLAGLSALVGGALLSTISATILNCPGANLYRQLAQRVEDVF